MINATTHNSGSKTMPERKIRFQNRISGICFFLEKKLIRAQFLAANVMCNP